MISSRFLFSNKSFTAQNPHSIKYDDGNGNSSSLAKLLVFGCLTCVSSHSHIIIPFYLNRALIESSFCNSESSPGYSMVPSDRSTSNG